MPVHDTSGSTLPRPLPLVGRSEELDRLYRLFGHTDAVEPMVILKGDGGVGKSRLAETVAAEAERRRWTVVSGHAYPVETGAPLALISDAFVPYLRGLDDETLTVLTRGEQSELRRLLPALGPPSTPLPGGTDPGQEQTRLFWHFSDLLQALASRNPLLVVLEDLHWADPSSLSLLHFLVRQVGDSRLRVLATFNTQYRDATRRLLPLERSLVSLRKLRLVPLNPLSLESTHDLIETVFDTDGAPIREFSEVLYGWTRGNPFFIEETLGALVASGRIHRREGVWLGWDSRALELPSSIRDAILARLDVSDEAFAVADVLAAAGAPVGIEVVERVAALAGAPVAEAVDELERSGLVEATGHRGRIELRFRHPLGRETLLQGLSAVRRRTLHRDIADALEAVHGERAFEHADEIAYHLVEAGASGDEPRTIRYLADAGRAALRRHADREAADYLERAESFVTARPPDPPDGEGALVPDLAELRWDLVRALARTGRYGDAEAVALRLLDQIDERAEPEAAARVHRRLGLIAFWAGRHEAALDRFDDALAAIGDAGPGLRARIHANAALALQELGRSSEGRREIEAALTLAEELGDIGLLGRVHRGLALLSTFTGEADVARIHARRAVEYGDDSGDAYVAFWGRWVLASLEGLSGGPVGIEAPLREARGAADALRNPVFGLWVTELEVEHAYFGGDWDRALALGERGIARAANLNQRALEVRLLVWTATCYLARGDLDRGRALVARATTAARLDEESGAPDDVHALVPAYIGQAALAIAEGDYETAVEVGRRGVELADRVGYVIWTVHRLLPLVGEAFLRMGDLEGASAVVRRLHDEGTRMGNQVALSYSSTGRALVAWHDGRVEEAVELLAEAARDLETIGFVSEAARIRRQLAARLRDVGRTDDALVELRAVHEVFGRLGARPELEKTREQFRELDARPPSRSVAEGTAELTGREAEVAALVADRKSNKAVARVLGISPRTVTTHLSNIYRKLDIGSRGELVDRVREGRLPLSPPPSG